MHYGSSEEKDSKEEAGPQDRGGEKVNCEEDRQRPAQEEIDLIRGAGLVPAPSLFSFQIKQLSGLSGAPRGRSARGFFAGTPDAVSLLHHRCTSAPFARESAPCFARDERRSTMRGADMRLFRPRLRAGLGAFRRGPGAGGGP